MTVTALLLRTMGIMFRVYMSNKIGAEGMGLYQLIFSIYILFTAFATSGITIAVTRVIADESNHYRCSTNIYALYWGWPSVLRCFSALN